MYRMYMHPSVAAKRCSQLHPARLSPALPCLAPTLAPFALPVGITAFCARTSSTLHALPAFGMPGPCTESRAAAWSWRRRRTHAGQIAGQARSRVLVSPLSPSAPCGVCIRVRACVRA